MKVGDLIRHGQDVGMIVALQKGSELDSMGNSYRIYFPHIYGKFMIFWEKELEVISEIS